MCRYSKNDRLGEGFPTVHGARLYTYGLCSYGPHHTEVALHVIVRDGRFTPLVECLECVDAQPAPRDVREVDRRVLGRAR